MLDGLAGGGTRVEIDSIRIAAGLALSLRRDFILTLLELLKFSKMAVKRV